jgi:GDP-4-dehydro-6-deoxy-D-mannose reductase
VRALVIGADGFAGRWLTRHLAESGDAVVAAVGPHFAGDQPEADEVVSVDVTDSASVSRMIQAAKPDATYYLAGVSRRGTRDAISAAANVTVAGSVGTLAGLSQYAHGSSLLFVSSAHVYESSPSPLDERASTRPMEVYGAAKLAAEQALGALAPLSGVLLAIARPFNHIGPGQRDGFLVPKVASQLRDVAMGRSVNVSVGAVDDVLDFSDVRDVVRAYRVIATSGQIGLWNVASGRGWLIDELIGQMVELAGGGIQVVSTPPPSRAERRTLIGDATKLRAIGWVPEHDLIVTLREIVDGYLIDAVASSPAAE